MGILKTWLRTASPMTKVLMAISVTSGVVIVHRLYYGPYTRRKRQLQAEEWAKIIIEREDAMEDSTEI